MPPPVVAFALGSLGFLTPHSFEKYRELLNKVFDAPVEDVLKANDEEKSKLDSGPARSGLSGI
ncbi:hypothetical protein Pmar_PMAR013951 [Perkinsus marinus ATCC 50983]|uniref:Uncharacterized protein n=1 Tax=Perkinsus marinus (strain ATCC 50983 / TXsc) TaxID=423536 RepID=C5KN29_PERM5|nr:hypothetical protein Pmar_PMAR013951 [Perkinsus marinus ATCC 50983]EER14113.1 hypothetical protein Pmar_PMAR013951 [Perkinsus marinus ATCC 50983]|eukprot:XP_002782318.1 hypothetical protein Pmar_PMAR013951 [Perkinsus marinus ATCC 50983]